MNVFAIAWRNIRYRSLASFLTTLSMVLGVGLTVLVMSISGIINQSFQRNSNVGYNLIVGSKGSATQLVLNGVYYLDKPIENIKYSYYMEFLPGKGRQEDYALIGGNLKEPDRAGLYSMYMTNGFAIPILLGDYVGRFRAVATNSKFFELLHYGELNDQAYRFAHGRNFLDESPEHGFFEAVLGSEVAREMQLKLGDQIQASHGSDSGVAHQQGFVVVGILASTGTPNDRAAFLNMEGFYLLEDHAAPERDEGSGLDIKKEAGSGGKKEEGSIKRRLPIEQRELTAILVRTPFAMGIEKPIKKTAFAQAVSPVLQIVSLLKLYIEPVQWALLVLTLLVCVVSAVSILVSIYNSMNERTRDIAVMRALGASRDTVLTVILCESFLIAMVGGLVGWFGAHAIAALFSPFIEHRTGVKISLASIHPYEFWIIPFLVVIGILAGLIPALVAYRTDVSKSL